MISRVSHLQEKKSFEVIAITGLILLFYGFLFNRVVNNIGSIIIGVYTIIKIRENKSIFFHPWMISIVLISTIPFVSDILIDGLEFYKQRGEMKLLMILYPAFIFSFKPDRRIVKNMILFFLIIMFISSCYSLFYYWKDFDEMFITYKQSRIVKTLSLGDHIRISWATIVSCILALYLIYNNSHSKKYLLWIYIIFQIIFIHILGSKTGLISLYLSAFIFLIYQLKNIKKWLLITIIGIICIMPYIAYKSIPSFEQRINFIKYDFEYYSKGEYREGLSDAVRFYSLMAGKDIISEHPWLGCGFSKLQGLTNGWFRSKMPQIGEENYFLPSSQIVIYWASGGLFCLIIFLFHLLYPLHDIKLRTNIWFMMFFIPAAISFSYETHLEGQLPLFFYSFFISFFWYLAYLQYEK